MNSPTLLPVSLAVLGVACGDAEPVSTALQEPIRVASAQFREGTLPGRRPLNADEIKAGKEPKKPYSTPIDVSGSILSQTEIGFSIAGRASTDSYSVAFALEDAGTGYWVLPVGSPDPANKGELIWRTSMDLGGVTPGMHNLLVAAVDGKGNSGTQRAFQFCARAAIEDNLNACVATRKPPELVVSLGWSHSADLDLRVLDQAGNIIGFDDVQSDAKGNAGRLQRDANANCSDEGAPRESVIWDEKPKAGLYYVYVNLRSPCAESAAPFVVTTHASKRAGKDEYKQVEVYRISGELLASQASDNSLGTFVTEIVVK